MSSPRAYDIVADELHVLIAGGHVGAGERLPSERRLAARFAVSRPTIRVALSLLEARGLVVTRPGSGTFVAARKPSGDTGADVGVRETTTRQDDPVQVMEARLTLEVALARLAARRAAVNRTELEEIRILVETLERVAAPGDPPIDIDCDFHSAIARLTGNEYLSRVMESVLRAMRSEPLQTLLHEAWTPDHTRRTAAEHRSIYEALRIGDAELAAFAMERHLRSLVAVLFDEGAFEGPPPRFYA